MLNRNKLIGYGILTLVILISIGFAFAESVSINKDSKKEVKSSNVCFEKTNKGYEFTNITYPLTMYEISQVYIASDTKVKNKKECFDVVKEVVVKDDKILSSKILSIDKVK